MQCRQPPVRYKLIQTIIESEKLVRYFGKAAVRGKRRSDLPFARDKGPLNAFGRIVHSAVGY